MSANRLHFAAITPDRTVLEQEIDFVVLRTREGDMGILPGHEPCCVELAEGIAKLYQGQKQTDSLAVMGGFALVQDNRVTVLSAIAERPDRMEALLADLERQRQEKIKQEKRSALEIQRAETALRRMLVQSESNPYSAMTHPEHGDVEGKQDEG
ncbi:MAG: ATP synthase F1 subunit epsilon [Oscillospiraceae bacterium]|jgi:F-type H+-transporting ATPase subunit epsilon